MTPSFETKKILVAPLNWGLGHATRCIPIIKALIYEGFEPIIASDGYALELLKHEFKGLTFINLPSYKITYAKKGKNFKWKLLKDSPKIMRAVWLEHRTIKQIVKDYAIDGIISDNRLGVYSKKVPSVFITHQLNVMTGNSTKISSWLHQKIIKRYNVCWVPDVAGSPNLSGELGHLKDPKLNIIYIGPLSRLQYKERPIKHQLMVLLSGPEPQRSMLEEKLIEELKHHTEPVLMVRGVMETEKKITHQGALEIHNFMVAKELEKAINSSKMVLSRSGYTTVMDLACLKKPCFFIPTPGQYEQEYLAKKYQDEGLVPFNTQDNFRLSDLENVLKFKGLPKVDEPINWENLFEVFTNEQAFESNPQLALTSFGVWLSHMIALIKF